MKARPTPQAAAARPDPLRQLIASALPRRRLKVGRDVLIEAIHERIQTWCVLEPLTGPHAAKVRRYAAVAKRLTGLQAKVADEMDRLLGLGAHRTESVDAVTGEPVSSFDVGRPLYLACQGALAALREVERWNGAFRQGQGRPGAFRVALTKDLQHLVQTQAGCTGDEFEEFLRALNDSDLWSKAGLPRLSTAALTKRKQRQKQQKKRRTK